MLEPNEHQDRLTRSLSTLCWVLPFGQSGLQFYGLHTDIPCSSWLDETPSSRIIIRCTQDIATVDGNLSWSFGVVVKIVLEILTKLGGPVLFTPIFLLPGASIAIFGVYIGNIYLKAQMSVKREKRYVQGTLIFNEVLHLPFFLVMRNLQF